MIEITCNDRLGKKVRVKCKYLLSKTSIACKISVIISLLDFLGLTKRIKIVVHILGKKSIDSLSPRVKAVWLYYVVLAVSSGDCQVFVM